MYMELHAEYSFDPPTNAFSGFADHEMRLQLPAGFARQLNLAVRICKQLEGRYRCAGT